MENTLREKEQELGLIKQRHSDDMSRLMDEMRQLRENYNEKIREYEALLDLRIQLEQEIATLSALLQEEEIRYALLNALLSSCWLNLHTRSHEIMLYLYSLIWCKKYMYMYITCRCIHVHVGVVTTNVCKLAHYFHTPAYTHVHVHVHLYSCVSKYFI